MGLMELASLCPARDTDNCNIDYTFGADVDVGSCSLNDNTQAI